MDYEKLYKSLKNTVVNEYLNSDVPEITRDLALHYFRKGRTDALFEIYKNICDLEEINRK